MLLLSYLPVAITLFGFCFSDACLWNDAIYSGGTCFLLVEKYKDYPNAKTYCNDLGGAMAIVKTAEQVSAIMTNITTEDVVHIGAKYVGGKWTWEYTGNEATELKQLWDDNQPDTTAGRDCVLMKLPKMISYYCSEPFWFVCMEVEATTITSSSQESTTTQSVTSSQTAEPITTILSTLESTTTQSVTSSQTAEPITTILSILESTTTQLVTSSQAKELAKCNARKVQLSVIFLSLLYIFVNLVNLTLTTNYII